VTGTSGTPVVDEEEEELDEDDPEEEELDEEDPEDDDPEDDDPDEESTFTGGVLGTLGRGTIGT